MSSYFLSPSDSMDNTYTVNLDYETSLEYSDFYRKVKDEIFKYVIQHFKPYTSDEPSYGAAFIDLQQNSICNKNIFSTFTSIQALSPQDYKYGRAFYPSSTSITFYRVTPSVEEFNENTASNYFDVDEVWRDELRGKI